MKRFLLPLASVLLLASCAPHCGDEGSSRRVADSEEPTRAPAEPSSLKVREAHDGPSVGSASVPRTKLIYATRTKCMRPCAVQFDAQSASSLSWPEIRDSEFVWDFDDGGSRTDSEGFLAAVVYERAGTYRPTVTVDGETWNPQTITVTDPAEVACVSPSSDWTNCPGGAEHYTSLSAALSGTGSNAHILLEGGVSHGALPDGGSDTNVLIGAYDNGAANPTVTASDVTPPSGWSYQDLIIKGSSRLFEGFGLGSNVMWNRVAAPSGQQFLSFVFKSGGTFVFDSDIQVGAYGIFIGNAACDRFVFKNSTIAKTAGGQHTVRVQDCDRMLIQNSNILGMQNQTSLTIRGASDWTLVQNVHAERVVAITPENMSENTVRRWMIFERVYVDASYDQGIEVRSTQDAIFRNNIVKGSNTNSSALRAEDWGTGRSQNLKFFNNTYYQTTVNDTAQVVICTGSGCEARNNLAYGMPNSSATPCVSGGTQSNNWCYSSVRPAWCRDPVTGNSTCYDPSFESTTYGNPGFMRPGPATRGIDAGDRTPSIWDDYHDAPRSAIDVGAVER